MFLNCIKICLTMWVLFFVLCIWRIVCHFFLSFACRPKHQLSFIFHRGIIRKYHHSTIKTMPATISSRLVQQIILFFTCNLQSFLEYLLTSLYLVIVQAVNFMQTISSVWHDFLCSHFQLEEVKFTTDMFTEIYFHHKGFC